MARSLHPALKARVAMLKAYAKTHNCSYKEAMIATKGKKGARRTKKHGGGDGDEPVEGGAEPTEAGQVGGDLGGAPADGMKTSGAEAQPAQSGGRRRRKSARRTCRRSRKRSHRRRR
jgi:hypothetical protein